MKTKRELKADDFRWESYLRVGKDERKSVAFVFPISTLCSRKKVDLKPEEEYRISHTVEGEKGPIVPSSEGEGEDALVYS